MLHYILFIIERIENTFFQETIDLSIKLIFILLNQLKSNPDPDSFNDFKSFSLNISFELYSGKSILLKLKH